MEEVAKWVEKAEHDLNAAEVNLKEGIYDVSAFFSQQAAEKSLKALYISKYKELWKIHDLYELAIKVEAPKTISDICEKLTQHYIATMYPNDEEYSKEDAEEAVEQAKKVMKWVKEKL
ncbi:MAG: HEPN domain-containing protein [Candidatus Aenigmarchaeota archaeon]|nr:HEPN domain-containing protein [Candidatus Aenigmarchaeota archaeon]